jgi:hypothetical protein
LFHPYSPPPPIYVDYVLPTLSEEVLAWQELTLQGPSTAPAFRKEIKTRQSKTKWKECDYDGKNATALNTHMRLAHKKVSNTTVGESKLTLEKNKFY